MVRRIFLMGLPYAVLAWAQPPGLSGIAHVAFSVADLEESRAFYQKLGFEQAFEFRDPGRPPVSYMKVNDRQFIELYQHTPDSQAIGLMHICYESNEIQAVHDDYVKRGLSPSKVNKARAGNLLFVLRDPEQQMLEYTQYMPGSLHYEDRGKHLGGQRIGEHMQLASIPVKDVAAERAFYTGKLAFEVRGGKDPARLRLPGGSGDEVELVDEAAAAKPRIVFLTKDPQKASEELRVRGIAAQVGRNAVAVSDPDGATIVFTTVQN